MHELAITQAIVEAAAARSGGAKVVRVVVEIGKLSGVMPDALRFCFGPCCEGTPLAGATLDVEEPPGLAACRACGDRFALEALFGACACGSRDLDLISGRELRVREMEVI